MLIYGCLEKLWVSFWQQGVYKMEVNGDLTKLNKRVNYYINPGFINSK